MQKRPAGPRGTDAALMRILKYFIITTMLISLQGTCPPGFADTPGGSAFNWNLWRGPDRNGISKETEWDPEFLKKSLKLNWTADVGFGLSNVSIYGEYLYTSGSPVNSDTNIIYCLYTATGEEKWRYSYRSVRSSDWVPMNDENYQNDLSGPRATPVVFDDRVYTLGQDGDFLCNEAFTGKLLWHKNINREFSAYPPSWQFTSSVHIEGDMAVVNAGKAGLALNRLTGEAVWYNGKGIGNYSTPLPYTANGRRRIALFGQHELYGLDASSGNILWSYPWKTKIFVTGADPAICKNGVLFIVSLFEVGCALIDVSEDKPVTLWRNSNLKTQYRTPIVIGDHIYGIDQPPGSPDKLTCLDVRNGSVSWSQVIPDDPGLTAANGHLFVLNQLGDLRVVRADPDKYTEISFKKRIMARSCIPTPVLCGATLYIKNHKGKIISIDVSKNRKFSLKDYNYFLYRAGSILKNIAFWIYDRAKDIIRQAGRLQNYF